MDNIITPDNKKILYHNYTEVWKKKKYEALYEITALLKKNIKIAEQNNDEKKIRWFKFSLKSATKDFYNHLLGKTRTRN